MPLTVLRRAGVAVVTLLISSFVVYSALYVAPGDPTSVLSGGRPLDPATRAAIAAEYDLDQPFPVRYLRWLGNVLHGDFGTSIVFQSKVTDLLLPRVATTVFLLTYAAILILVVGIGGGVLWGLRGRVFALVSTTTTAFAIAVPSFVAAVVLTTVFGVNLGWFPVTGAGSGFVDRLHHLTLPAIALALPAIAYVARMTRLAVGYELGSDHVTTATARGLPSHVVIRRHVLRNAAIPITTVVGITVASLVGAAAIVERAFQLDGLGSFLVDSVGAHDFPVVQAICLLFVAAFVIVNSLVDALYSILDPRIARSG